MSTMMGNTQTAMETQDAAAPTKAVSGGKNVTIRLAENMDDVEKLVDLGRLMHAESQFRAAPYNPDKLREFGKSIFEDDKKRASHCLLMAEMGEETVGMMLGNVNAYFFSDMLAATDLAFFVKPEKRGSSAAIKLLHGFKRWCRDRKVAHIYINVATGVHMARTDKLMRRLGFQFVGGNYVLGVGR